MADEMTTAVPAGRSRLPKFVERVYRRFQELICVRGPVQVGRNLRIGRGALISSFHGLTVGDSVSVGRGSVIEVDGVIGDYCLMGRNVLIAGRVDHAVDEVGVPMAVSTWIGERPQIAKDMVTIGRDVWIGAGAIILGGVAIGDGAIVGAGAVVTRDIESFGIVAGNPARTVKLRFSSEMERSRHLVELARRCSG